MQYSISKAHVQPIQHALQAPIRAPGRHYFPCVTSAVTDAVLGRTQLVESTAGTEPTLVDGMQRLVEVSEGFGGLVAAQRVASEPTNSVREAIRCIDLSEATQPETRSVRPVREGTKLAIDRAERT